MSYLTKFEKIRVLGTRATQISNGAPPTIDVRGLVTAMDIAKRELQEGKIPLVIQRTYPDGKIVEIPVSKFQKCN